MAGSARVFEPPDLKDDKALLEALDV